MTWWSLPPPPPSYGFTTAAFWTRSLLPVLYDERTFRDYYGEQFEGFWGESRSRAALERRSDWQRQFDRLASDLLNLEPAIADSPADRPAKHAVEFTDPSQCIVHDPHGEPAFQARFNVKSFKPEEISVSTKGNQVLVTAKREPCGDGTESEGGEYNRRVDLPPGVDVGGVTSTLSEDGVLVVDAPLAGRLAAAADADEAAGGDAVAPRRPRERFAFQLPLPGRFEPGEIRVSADGRRLAISGRRGGSAEAGAEEGAAATEERRRAGEASAFSKQYLLPPDVDAEKVSVYLKDGRRVVVEATVKGSSEPAPQVHALPVERSQLPAHGDNLPLAVHWGLADASLI